MVVLIVKALVGAFNQEKAPVGIGAFSVIVETDGSFAFAALYPVVHIQNM